MHDKLIYGAAYYYEYLPYDRMRKDFAMMKTAGFTTIRIAESTWSTWEPRDGEFDFTDLHRVLNTSAEFGLDVIVGTPTYAIPAWLAKKYPDVLSDTHSGRCRYGHRQNFDCTHPGYRFHAERIIRRLMEEVQGYRHIIGFQLDNETKPYDTCSEQAQRMFLEKLKQKFGSTERLNQAMGLAYWSNSIADWEDLPDVRGTINASFGAEFEAFQRSLVTEFLAWQRAIVDEYRRPDQFVTHNFDYEWRMHSFGLQPEVDQFEAAKSLTISGCDIYHPSEHALTGAEIAFGGASAYGLKRDNYLVLETQAQGNFGWLPYPGQLRLQAFAHLASGADGVSYWHWHSIHNAIESYWKGVLSHDFSAGAVYQEAAAIGRDFARLSSHLIHLKKQNRVAVMVSNRSQTGLRWFPTSHQQDAHPDHTYSDYLRWLCDACYRLNIEYDVISDAERSFSAYDAVILPTLYSADEELIAALRAYVSGGGHLIATFKTCFADKYLKIYHDAQPHGLTDCFGLTYDRFTKPVGVTLRLKDFPGCKETAAADFAGCACEVTDWMELLTPTTARVLAVYRHPAWDNIAAVTENSFGSGSAVYLGCCFSSGALETLLTQLFRSWEFPLPDIRFPLVCRHGINTLGRRITYLMNFSADSVGTQAPCSGTELLSCIPCSRGEEISLTGWEVKIFEENAKFAGNP